MEVKRKIVEIKSRATDTRLRIELVKDEEGEQDELEMRSLPSHVVDVYGDGPPAQIIGRGMKKGS